MAETVAKTKSGKLEGYQEEGLFIFKGIPYAAPPIGPRRWLPPEPVKPWKGVRPAQSYGAHAPQSPSPDLDIFKSFLTVPGEASEDCLFLNIWTPGLDDGKRPVLFWIHGGGWEMGSGSQPNYDGTTLARRGDAVVVTINYRLGALGFLNLNEITGGKIPATGNNGRLDQDMALRWVRENIAAFGGDPENVTIFGESAGSVDCAVKMATPGTRGLFRRVINESCAAHTAQTRERAELISKLFLEILEIKPADVETIRSLPVEKLLYAATQLVVKMPAADPKLGIMHFQPVIDGNYLHEMPIEAIRKGASGDVSLLAGNNLNETRVRLAAASLEMTEEELAATYGNILPAEDASKMIETFKNILTERGEAAAAADLYMAMETERVIRIPTIRLLEAKRKNENPGFGYLFTRPSPVSGVGGELGACHAIEMGFVWNAYDGRFCGSGPEADALAAKVQDAWISFARTGDPSCASLGAWPSYGGKRETMLLGAECRVVNDPYEKERRAWEDIPETALGYVYI